MQPQHLAETLQRLGCSQSAFAGIAGVNGVALSQFLRGCPKFSGAALQRIEEGLRDVVRLAQQSPLPIDWRRIGEVRTAIACMRLAEKSEPEKAAKSNVTTAVAALTA
jgi:hypothetical protein